MIYWIDTSVVIVQRVVLAVVKAPLRSFRSSLGESFFFRGPIENKLKNCVVTQQLDFWYKEYLLHFLVFSVNILNFVQIALEP